MSGPGGPRGDKIPAWLSDEEFVVNAAMAKKHRRLLDMINADQIPAFRDGTPAIRAPVMPRLSHSGGGGGSGIHVTYAPVYHVTGSGPEIDKLRAEMARDRQQFKGRVVDAVADARRRNINI